jgi:hypothetical protein
MSGDDTQRPGEHRRPKKMRYHDSTLRMPTSAAEEPALGNPDLFLGLFLETSSHRELLLILILLPRCLYFYRGTTTASA